jgi:hypothetical protein
MQRTPRKARSRAIPVPVAPPPIIKTCVFNGAIELFTSERYKRWSPIALYQIQIGYNRFLPGDKFFNQLTCCQQRDIKRYIYNHPKGRPIKLFSASGGLDSKLRPQPQNLIDFYRKMFNIQAIISGRGLIEGLFHSEGDPFDRVVIRSLEQ